MIEIGSSEAPVILGVSPHKTARQLWQEKVELVEAKDEATEVMRRGTQLQVTVLAMLADDLGVPFDPAVYMEHTGYHKDRPWQRATPDMIWLHDTDVAIFAVGHCSIAEVKCTVAMAPDVPRVDWLVQVLHQRLVFPDAEHAYLAAFGGLTLKWWDVPKHQRAMDRILRAEEAFLEAVEKEVPPPPTHRDASSIARSWPYPRAAVKILDTPEARETAARYELAKAAAAAATQQEQQGAAEMKALIGDATAAVVPGVARYTFKPYQVNEQLRKAYTARPLKRVGKVEEDA
jgi:predicted phage-related endonuclease